MKFCRIHNWEYLLDCAECTRARRDKSNPAGALTVHQLAAVSSAIRETIEAGCVRHKSPHWLLHGEDRQQEVGDFITEVTRRLVEKAK